MCWKDSVQHLTLNIIALGQQATYEMWQFFMKCGWKKPEASHL